MCVWSGKVSGLQRMQSGFQHCSESQMLLVFCLDKGTKAWFVDEHGPSLLHLVQACTARMGRSKTAAKRNPNFSGCHWLIQSYASD